MKKALGFIKNHKKAIIIIAIIAVVAFAAVKIGKAVKNAQNLLAGMQSSGSTAEIEERDIVNSVTATGTIVAVDKRTVSSTITGVKIKQVNVEVGDQVNAGDILCLLDGEDLEAQLADAEKMRNADAGRSSIDVASSNRNLNEAIAERDIDSARAVKDKNSAYQQIQTAANECQEAKDAYDAAVGATKDSKDILDSAESRYNVAVSSASKVPAVDVTAVSNAQTAYNTVFTELETYLGTITEQDKIQANWKDTIDPANGFCSPADPDYGEKSGKFNVKATTIPMVYFGENEVTQNMVSSYLSRLGLAWDQYVSACTPVAPDASSLENASASYQQAKAAYESAKAKEESLKAAYEAKAKTVESLQASYETVERSADDKKRMNDSTVAARADVVKSSQLNAGVATVADDRNIKHLQEQIDGCVVASSIDGIVTDVSVYEGDMYAGGSIVTIENTSDYEISAFIDEYDIAKIKAGQEVIVKTNGTGSLEMKGQVKSIAPHATTSPTVSGVKYEVIISMLEKNPDLRLDMTAKVEIICEKSESVLSVASEAIQEDNDGKFFVEVIDSGDPVDSSSLLSNPEEMKEEDIEKLQSGEKTYESHKVFVTKGLVGDYYTEISGEGLEIGMKIIIPNDGAFSDIEEYMEKAGAAGGF